MGEIFLDILTNHMILVPLIAWAVSQVVKTIINVIKAKSFSFKYIVSDGGMPSAHVATVVSLATMCGWVEGYDSALFALASVVAVVIIRDSVGVRFDTGVNARAIKKLVDSINKDLPDASKVDVGKLKLVAGHTTKQVIAGFITGVAVAVLYILISGNFVAELANYKSYDFTELLKSAVSGV